MNNKKATVLSGVFWKFGERILAQLVSTAVAVVLARILSPDEYGTISIVTVFINIANMLMTAGFSTSLVQKERADELDFSTVFHFSVACSLVLYGIIYISAPYIAQFYQIAELCSVLRILGLSVPVTAINAVQQAYISRKMIFKRFFYSTLAGTLLSSVVGIWMAYRGFGVYALVAQNLISVFVSTLVLWFTSGLKLHFQFSFARLKGLFSYGWKLLVQNIVLNVYSSLRSLIIGKVYTTADLAYYTKGSQYPNLIATNVDTALNTVLFPAMAKEQTNLEKLKSMIRRTTKLSSYVMSPILIGFIAVAEPFLAVLLTEKWLPAVPYLRIICIVLLFLPPQTTILQGIKAVGRSDVVLKIDLPVRIVATLLLLVSVRFGTIYIALSEVATTVFGTAVYMYSAKKIIGYKYKEVCADFISNIALSAAMGLAVWLLGNTLSVSWSIQLLVQVVAGVVLYIGLSIIVRNESCLYVIREIKSFLAARKGGR